MDAYMYPFDAKHPWVYVIISVLVTSLLALRLPHKDTLFILLNVIIYTAITSGIFYGYTKYEEKKITEKYIRNILGLLYDKDKKTYNEMLEYLRKEKTSTTKVHFVEKYSTIILSSLFAFVSIVYYAVFRRKISLTSIGRNTYYLSILGFTELFIAFFVMTRIPHQDVINLMDTFIRSIETCTKKNAIFMSNQTNKNDFIVHESCNSFSKDGDTCITHDTAIDEKHFFVCNDGKINRKRSL
ncbi:MAG: hypothetical protein CL842_05550 [Crocinitomicaceae bacterium]|nr:hypothetical protein [Crocinitomicaceae bacterium]